ncbi:MAG: hypothetical protein QOD31_3957, partial [Pseudonocardiales bacterium]|nr:hypothetical protein [Pseudonocardiales bacterium]
AAEGAVSRDDLILISEDDVRGSRVFDEAAEPDAEDRVRLS